MCWAPGPKPKLKKLAWPVDYWDGLGWRDRFAIPEAVQRQRRYAQTLHHGGVFTPQVVADANSSLLGADRPAIVAHIEANTSAFPVTLAVDKTELKIEPQMRPGSGPDDANLVGS